MNELQCGRYRLSLERPLLMGIINVTPDSFSGDGVHTDLSRAAAQARRMIEEGAALLDIGGESSRPGAQTVEIEDELRRVLPLLEALADCGVPLSVDTAKPAVMRQALAAGADMINDINALRAPGALEAVAGSGAALCLMHMRGEPRTMQECPHYEDAVAEVRDFLVERVTAARAAGIADARIVIDPGFGFGKSLAHNLTLLRHLDQFAALGLPLLAGLSRKSMLGKITGRQPEQRLAASVAAALLAAQRGAKILRVHDVAATRDALAIQWAVDSAE